MDEPAEVPHQVLSAASHELRGPLGVARGYLRLLQSQLQSDPQALKSIAQASRATDQMAAILDDLSRYARLVRGEARLHPAVSPLAAVLAVAIPQVALPADPAVEVVSDVPGTVTVWADPAASAQFCATAGTALARAAVAACTLVFSAREAPDGIVEVCLGPRRLSGAGVERRPPRLDRSGVGMGLALAELAFRLQGGGLEELWMDGRWEGYSLRFPRPPHP